MCNEDCFHTFAKLLLYCSFQLITEIISCNEALLPAIVLNSSYTLLDGDTQYGATVTFTCHDGYKSDNSEDLTCNETGDWSGTPPVCTIVSCNTIDTLDNGIVIGNVYTFGAVITFNCSNGFQLNGASSIQCLADASWSASIPSCVVSEDMSSSGMCVLVGICRTCMYVCITLQ